MELFVGVGAAKDVHWVFMIDGDARPVFSRLAANEPAALTALVGELRAAEAKRVTVALDLLGNAALRDAGRGRAPTHPHAGPRGQARLLPVHLRHPLHPESRAFWERRLAEAKRHNQAVIALARRRMNVLWAALTTRTPFQLNFKAN